MTLEEISWHYNFGIKSGIPKCCIDFWINEYVPLLDQNKEIILYYHLQIKRSGLDYDYIPCPRCLETKTKMNLIICEADELHPGRQVPIYHRLEWEKGYQ